MNDATHNDGSGAPTPPIFVNDDEAFYLTRPADVDADQWADVRRQLVDELDHRLGRDYRIPATCEHDWCTLGRTSDHLDFHVGDTVTLLRPNGESDEDAWHCWIAQAEGEAWPQIVLEGWPGGVNKSFAVPVALLMTSSSCSFRCWRMVLRGGSCSRASSQRPRARGRRRERHDREAQG